MHTIATTTSTRPVVAIATDTVTGKGLIEAVHAGKVRFAKVRETGTLRSWPVLVPGSAQRKQAEEIMKARAAKQPVEAIAKSLNVSVPTVRRAITALAFTMEVESLKVTERNAIAKALNSEPKAPKVEKKEQPAKAEPKAPAKAKPAAPKEGSATAKALAAKAKKAEQAAKAPVKADKSHTA